MEAVKKGKIVKYNKLRICIGGLIDLIGAILNSIALNYVAGSVYQMMRGGTIAATFFFSVISLKMKAKRHQYAGSALAIIGLLIVGISNFLYKSSKDEDGVNNNKFRFYLLSALGCLLLDSVSQDFY